MAHGWTPERRARQAEAIRSWRPWSKSTGPKTSSGKAIAARNRQASLDKARAEVADARAALAAAQAKVARLTRHDC